MLTIYYEQSWDSETQSWVEDTEVITFKISIKDNEAWFTIDNNDDGQYDVNVVVFYPGNQPSSPESDYTVVFYKM